MKLNRKKCVHIRMNGVGTVRFVDGSELEQTVDATYLGTKITADAKGDREINKRIGECGGIMKNLDPVRENKTAGVKARIQVFMMVVKAKLVYGLEACRLMESSCKKIDAFQIRELREILGLKHVYYGREHTNQNILGAAAAVTGKPVVRITDWMKARTVGVWPHLIRAEEWDVMKQPPLPTRHGERNTDKGLGMIREEWGYHVHNGPTQRNR